MMKNVEVFLRAKRYALLLVSMDIILTAFLLQIKLKVHKDAADLERDANREHLLHFLNSACE